MSLVLGVDPGIRNSGYCLLSGSAAECQVITSGVITTDSDMKLAIRILSLRDGLKTICSKYKPEIVILEDVFSLASNVTAAIKLGQASGALIVAAAECGAKIELFGATTVKKVLTGYGRADKMAIKRALEGRNITGTLPKNSHSRDAAALAFTYLQLDNSQMIRYLDSSSS